MVTQHLHLLPQDWLVEQICPIFRSGQYAVIKTGSSGLYQVYLESVIPSTFLVTPPAWTSLLEMWAQARPSSAESASAQTGPQGLVCSGEGTARGDSPAEGSRAAVCQLFPPDHPCPRPAEAASCAPAPLRKGCFEGCPAALAS